MAPILDSLDFRSKKKDIACFSSIAMLLFLNNYKGKLPMNYWAALLGNLTYHKAFSPLFILLGNLYQMLLQFICLKKKKRSSLYSYMIKYMEP